MQSSLNELSDGENGSLDEEESISANYGVACRQCEKTFPSGNQLYSHLKSFNVHAVESPLTILDLTAQPKGDHPEGISNCTETRIRAY